MTCKICLREKKLTRHHFIPVSRHKNSKVKKMFSKEDLKKTVEVCRECHNQIHALISEKEMANEYNTLEAILEHEGVSKFTEWIRKKKPSSKIRVHSPRQGRRK